MKSAINSLTLFVVLLFSLQAHAENKKIGILAFDGVLTSDITAPLEVFGVASRKSWFSNYTPVLISVRQQPVIETEEGLKLHTDTWIGENPKVDALIIPSSYDMDPLIENAKLINFIKNASVSAEWLASNCSGAFLLGKAGLLDNLKATTWAGGERSLAKAFPKIDVQYDQNVVIDGNVITSNGSLVSYQAALVLLGKMTSESKANEVAEALQYKRFSQTKYYF